MSVSRLKTIIISALVLLNIVFLTVILMDRYADARNERQAIENVCTVLRANGITINPDDIRTGNQLRAMRTTRVFDVEEQIARAVLGEVVVMSDQGIIYVYENPERGRAEFYSGGYFEIQLNKGSIASSNGLQRTVEGLLRDMKLETSGSVVEIEADRETVTVLTAYRGISIFNCAIDFTFSDGWLLTITGRYVASVEPFDDSAGISTVGTVLLGFLAEVMQGEFECSHIYSIEMGYNHSVVGTFGDGVISPAWLFTTDTGRYIIDDLERRVIIN